MTKFSIIMLEKIKERKYFFALALILLLSFIIGVWNISEPSIFEDEYNAFIAAQLSCSHPLFITSMYEKHVWFFDHPYLGLYLYELSCIVPSLELMRMLNILFGLGAVFLTFLIGRKMFGEMAGILAALFLSLSMPFIAYSRIALLDTFVTFFMLLSFYFFIMKKEKTAWFSAGLAFATKITGASVAIVFLLYYIIKRRTKPRRIIVLLFLFILAFFIGNIGAFFIWDEISPNRGIYTEVPLVIKQFLAVSHGSAERGALPERFLNLGGALLYQTMFLPLFLALTAIVKHRKADGKKDSGLHLLALAAVVTFFIGVAAGSFTRYLLYVLPFISIIASAGAFALTKYRKYVIILLVFYFSYATYQIITLSPYYNLYGYGIERSGADMTYSSFREETISYINNHTTSSDKIMLLGNTYHIKSFLHFKPLKYNIFYNANETDNPNAAKYVIMDLTYKNSTVMDDIKNSFILEKTFEAKNITFVWIYRNPAL